MMYSVIYHASLKRAPAGSSFNQNISMWNIIKTEKFNKNYMFCPNTIIPFCKLNKRLSNIKMFNYHTFSYLCEKTFFDEPYKSMNLLKRQQIFNDLFVWDRRKNFIMFLTCYNYNNNNNNNNNNNKSNN